jgi:hypothetical protein
MLDIDAEAEQLGVDVDDIDIDHDQYKQGLAEWITDWYIKNLNNVLPSRMQFVKPKNISMSSPRYYNYWTDSINIELDVKKKELDKFIKENRDWLDVFLEKYSSRDGFISFTPSSYGQLISEDDTERVVMCILEYLLKDDEQFPLQDFDSYEIIYNNLIYPN